MYLATRGWPRDELYGLTSQARRSAVSIPENIAGRAAAASPIGYVIVGFARRPVLWRDWIGFYLLLWGIAEQGALTNLPSVFSLVWFLAMAALALPDARATEASALAKPGSSGSDTPLGR